VLRIAGVEHDRAVVAMEDQPAQRGELDPAPAPTTQGDALELTAVSDAQPVELDSGLVEGRQRSG
jgi:hypothetical protein